MTAGERHALTDRYVVDEGNVQLTGVQSLVRVLFDRIRHDRALEQSTAGFVSGYEGSPLAGLDLELGRRRNLLDEYDLVHRPGLNEELAATAVFGTQLAPGLGTLRHDGVVGFWYGKAPGLDRASDALRHANMAGTHPLGGAVVLVGDDPSAKSSSVPSGSEHILADLGIPVLYPADSQDIVDFGRHAVELSRAAGVWAGMKIVANVADASSTTRVTSDWTAPKIEGGYRHQPNGRLLGAELAALERSFYEIRLPLALDYVRASDLNSLRTTPDDRIGIVTAGKSFLDVQEALLSLGIQDPGEHGVRILKLGVISPLDPNIVREFADGLSEIVVVEEKRGIIETGVKEVLYGRVNAPPIRGKELFPATGGIEPEKIALVLAPKIPTAVRPQLFPRARINLPLVSRTPYFCSGCPHNSSTKVPEGTLVGGGIGCHTMVLFQSPDQAGEVVGITQMGGEGAQWIGMSPFVESAHWTQNIGDGTFWHSGSLAVRAAVAAGVNVTFKLLHNSVVAMTGGQEAVGSAPIPRLAALLLSEGVSRIVITSDKPSALKRTRFPAGVTVRHRNDLIAIQKELATVDGVTFLIHDQECATEVRRKRKRGQYEPSPKRIAINQMVCEGCGDCGSKSNCLSVRPVDTEFGRKTEIHQESCTVDASCIKGNCPSFIEVRQSAPKRRDTAPLSRLDIPEPARAISDNAAIRLVGIGGTGVVTAAQTLAVAAFLDGKYVRTLDQTGLAQKGGAVVSDVRISSKATDRTAKISARECDVYLAADIVAGADLQNLRVLRPDRSHAVATTEQVPTGGMVTGREVFPDPGGLYAAIRESVEDIAVVDAHAVSMEYCGSEQYANMVLLGVAFQLGLLPLSDERIEQAIELNGTAVDPNIQAFRRGRQTIVDRQAPRVVEDPPASERADALPEIDRLVATRTDELRAYQDEKYARSYADFVDEVRVMSGADDAVVEAVARQLHRLMAYKDEYEVARLSLDHRLRSALENDFGTGARYRYLLRPPIFTWFGYQKKISVGEWFRVVFRLLYALRGVRGTAIDPFGYTRVRRYERALIGNYRDVVRKALSMAPGDPAVTQLAELPEIIRGYDEIKLDSIVEYELAQRALLDLVEEAAQPTPKHG